jgi:hypothetical protein
VADKTAEDIAIALGVALFRSGALHPTELARVADDAEAAGQAAAAHALRLIPIEAAAPTQGDWQASQRRGQMRVVRPD